MKLITHRSSLITPSRHGSVIVLVVAVLALLAVIGTVYIVSARSARSGAASGNTAANFTMAQGGVNAQAAKMVADSLTDFTGTFGGTAGPGDAWQVANLYRQLSPPGAAPDMTLPAARFVLVPDTATGHTVPSPSVFDPATGQFDIPVYLSYTNGVPSSLNTAVYTDVTPINQTLTAGMFRVVADPLPTNAPYYPTGPSYRALDDAYVQLLPFSEANGTRYRFGLRILDTSRMANLNVGSIFNPSSPSVAEGSGTYYNLYSLAPSAFFNINDAQNNLQVSGAVGNANPGRQGSWTLPTAPIPQEWAWGQAALRFENPLLFGTDARFAMGGLPAPFDLSDEMELRAYGSLGTMAVPRPALGYGANVVWPFTLGNRQLNSTTVAGNFNRGYYTAYSYSREFRPSYLAQLDNPATSTAYQVLPQSGNWLLSPPAYPPTFPNGSASPFVWPTYPARIAANPDISTYTGLSDQVASDTLTIAAVNIATAMTQALGANDYSVTEARAFVANYLTARWNSWTTDPNAPPGVAAYMLPNGPSFVDTTGPCLRGGLSGTGSSALVSANYTSGLNSGPTNLVYLGYAAQPFLNEIAVQYEYIPPAGAVPGQWIEQDGAIELYNPYFVPLSLEGFGLLVNGVIIDFTNKGQYVPAAGYFVITETKGQLDTSPNPIPSTAVYKDAGTLSQPMKFTGGTTVYLMRKYFDRNGATQWAAVDQYGVTNISAPPTSTPGGPVPPEIDFEARANNDTINGNLQNVTGNPMNANLQRWTATVHNPAHAEAKQVGPAGLTLGGPNSTANDLGQYVPLYDRTLELDAPPAVGGYNYSASYQRQVLLNVADFARLMRFCHQITYTTIASNPHLPAGGGPLSAQLLGIYQHATTPIDPVSKTVLPTDASLRFDFLTPPSGAPAIPANYNAGDVRANALLSCLAFTDRVSDYTINLGDGPGGLSKMSIPGQINVNTASAAVLATIPGLNNNPKLIGYILAYRARIRTDDPSIPPGLQSTGAALGDFTSASSDFPGTGIHSLGELAVPLAVAQKKAGVTFTTLYQRDQFWGNIYNCLTVRSDTFVVYAYLEAVRQNPRYTGHFNNGADWYTTGNGVGVTDDPTDSNHALFRVGRKRWLMLVDRSQVTNSSIQPRIVAIKDLPQ